MRGRAEYAHLPYLPLMSLLRRDGPLGPRGSPGRLAALMELLLIRHALPRRVELESGPADPELSETGHQQARHLAEYLEGEQIDRLVTSPLKRAVQTAAPITDLLGLHAEVHDGVSEFDAESSEYVPIEELKASNDPRWQEMLEGTWVPEGGMTRTEFRDIVVPAIDEIILGSPSQRVAVTCHGGVINAYFSHMLGLAEPMFFEPHYTSISRLVASSRGHRTLVSINEITHLPDARH